MTAEQLAAAGVGQLYACDNTFMRALTGAEQARKREARKMQARQRKAGHRTARASRRRNR